MESSLTVFPKHPQTATGEAGLSLEPDPATMRAFFAGVVPGVYELRIPNLGARRPLFFGTQAMYVLQPDDLEHTVQYLSRITGHNAGAIYICGNPVNPALLGRGRGSFYRAKATATDVDVARRHLFFVDVDAERPTGINASADEIEAAMARTAEAARWLDIEAGFGRPWFDGTSGSGGMLLYRIDLPNDDTSTAILNGCLTALAEAFPTDGVKIDTGVFNAARLFRVPGTVNAKSNTPQPDRPWSLVTGILSEVEATDG